ncbi:PTS fructose transporter subunit IIABC [Aerococcus suis]|uniref:PTS system, fructose-specific IIC component n=1 Tax=Aerococcus suis TaxID=371602 RepID=A0A1W1YBC4_9LACT|nr:fructose-specific PTS transporter subunit EIIC [Aerococcus suis]MDD7758661.1 fructose-specific PTS transporter subunit EIIC [Aerococcus suis]MDY4647091.1 fructose-specific PTS transporter subunit EIIC [Aerococcus suis]SMC33414.1 PTS system, fructose-specific IIC component [Aerococcus suis]
MQLSELFHHELMILDLPTHEKSETLTYLANQFKEYGGVTNVQAFNDALENRESQSTTGVGDEIAIPHAQEASIKEPAIIFGRSQEGIEWDSFDGQPAKLIFMIAAPEGGSNEHLTALAKLSSVLMNPEVKAQLLTAKSTEEVLALIQSHDEPEAESNEEEAVITSTEEDDQPYLVAVTACPTGIAHTYMAEEKLKQAAENQHVTIKVETNGQTGVGNRLSKTDIEKADAVIVAADRKVEMTRFDGKQIIIVPVADGINKADQLIEKAINGQTKTFHAEQHEEVNDDDNENESLGRQIYKHLMNGVSHMLPFVVAGGLLIAVSFFWGINSADPTDPTYSEAAHMIKTLGDLSFAMMLPVLAGFIGRSIADTPGLVIGMMGGVFADPTKLSAFSQEGIFADATASGFLGALVAGFLAGGIVWLLKRAFAWLPKSLEGMKPIFIYPVLGVLIMGLVMMLVINKPLGSVTVALTEFLAGIPTEWNIVLGFVAAAMMSIDMGGPINKAAYVTGTALVTQAAGDGSNVMAAVMIGGMVPPLAIALSATINKNLWPKAQRNSALINYVMGAAFITEGAIPFAATNPLKVIPSLAIGSGVAGALSMLFGSVSYVPHGGVFAMLAGGVSHPMMYALAWIIGGVVGAILLNILVREKK